MNYRLLLSFLPRLSLQFYSSLFCENMVYWTGVSLSTEDYLFLSVKVKKTVSCGLAKKTLFFICGFPLSVVFRLSILVAVWLILTFITLTLKT